MSIIKILFDKKILKYTILPFVIDLLFWGVIFLFFHNEIINFLESILSHLPFGDKIEGIVSNIGGWIFIAIFYYLAVISTLGIFSSFFIEKIVLRINEFFNCPLRETSFKDTLKGVLISLKSFFIYLIIFVFTFYLLFIPVINIFYQMFMMSLLNKKPLLFDSSYLFFEPEEIESKYNLKIWFLVFITSVVYLIPIISLFGYTFQLTIITYFILNQCKKLS